MDRKDELQSGYHVMVDDNFHYMDETYRECVGTFENYQDALALAQNIAAESVLSNKSSTAEETYEKYQSFGKDPFIRPFGEASQPEKPFSAWTMAKMVSEFMADGQKAIDAAYDYLGPEIDVSGIIENLEAPKGYGEQERPDCWRIYYQLKDDPSGIVGGSTLYLLVEKETGRILSKGTELGE
jgi:hypothetical protein